MSITGNDEFGELDPRAIDYWGSPTLALIMEAHPGTPLFDAVREQCLRSRAPDIMIYGYPDYKAVREERGLSIDDVADLWGVQTPLAHAIEAGWKSLPLYSTMWCVAQIGVSLGALFHDSNFSPRPVTRLYQRYLKADLDQIHL